MEYEGIGLHKQYPKGRKSGTISVGRNEILFNDGEQSVSLPLRNISITLGGAGNRYVYFKHESKPDWTFYTDEKKILNNEYVKDHTELRGSISKIKNKRRLFWATTYSIAGLTLAFFVAIFLFRGTIVEHVAMAVPVSWEQDISGGMLETATAGKTVVEDDHIYDELSKITTPLVNAVENKDFKFSFTIVEDPTINAFALPGGAIVIHSGLIEQATTELEVAGVLAHEISHVTRRHHIRGIVSQVGIFVLIRGLLGDGTGIMGELTALGASLESLKYSRDFETEADESGWELMEKANLDPRGMISFFEILHEHHGSAMDDLDFLSTHPGTGDRIHNLKQKTIKNKEYTTIDIDFEQFQKDLEVYFANH